VPRPIESLIKRFRPSPDEGARTTVMCATSAEVLAHRGEYYSVMELKEPSALATPELAAELWQRSEQWTDPASA
jgi:dehydrogenase/reductase SDR family protein 13